MGFDWFTFAAQVVNFLLLVWLLRRFLYGRIIAAMERREQRIADRLQEAAERLREAQEEARNYRQLERELAERRREILDRARAEAAELRAELLGEARRRVNEEEVRWREGLRQEKEAFLRELRRRTAEEVVELCRQVLEDLAGAELEGRAVARLAERIEELDDTARERLRRALEQADGRVRADSAFPIPEVTRAPLRRALDTVGCVSEMSWEVSPGLGFGVRLRIGDWQLGWSLESRVEALAERVGDLLASGERAPEPAAEAVG